MRVSTPALFNGSLANILSQQAAVAKSQEQVATGIKFKTAGENPSGMAQVLALQQAQAEQAQVMGNVTTLRQRMGTEENALASAGDVLSRVRELAVQANNATLSSENRKQIATELTQLKAQLVDIANTSDGIGHYIFGGTLDGSVPFASSASGVSYGGTQTVRELAVGEGRSMAEGDSGDAAFLRIPNGDGRLRVDAAASNTGSLSLRGVGVASGAAQALSISFSGGNYEVRDAGNSLLQSGSYSAGQSLTVAGATLSLAGTPADGDRLNIAPASNTDLFARVQGVIDATLAANDTPAAKALNQTQFYNALNELDGGLAHVSTVRASVGSRLATLDDVDNRLQGLDIQLQQTLSEVRDLDYAESISRLQLHSVALQAAQSAFAKVQGLSLFNYLR